MKSQMEVIEDVKAVEVFINNGEQNMSRWRVGR